MQRADYNQVFGESKVTHRFQPHGQSAVPLNHMLKGQLYVAFSGQLPPLDNMHLSFLQVLSWLDSFPWPDSTTSLGLQVSRAAGGDYDLGSAERNSAGREPSARCWRPPFCNTDSRRSTLRTPLQAGWGGARVGALKKQPTMLGELGVLCPLLSFHCRTRRLETPLQCHPGGGAVWSVWAPLLTLLMRSVSISEMQGMLRPHPHVLEFSHGVSSEE